MINLADSNGRPCIKPQPKAVRERTREDKCALVMSITQDEWKVTQKHGLLCGWF